MLVVLCLLLVLVGCTPQPSIGPPVDLTTIAQPDAVVPSAPPTPAVVTPPPSSSSGQWRAWIPPTQTANGDGEEGHWLTISTQVPALEEVEPAVPMPRAPRSYTPNQPVRGQSKGKGQAQPQTRTQQQPAMVPGTSLTPAPVPQPVMPAPVQYPVQPVQPLQAPSQPLPSTAYSEAVQRLQSLTDSAATQISTGGHPR